MSNLWQHCRNFYARRPRLAITLLFIAISLATRGFLMGVDILDVDEAMHLVGSWELLRGRHLYVGFVDNKPPLLYVYYALAQTVFGRGMFSVHLLTVLTGVPLIALGVSSFFGHDRRGVIAGVIYLVASAAYLAHDMHSVNCEILMLLPATWSVVVLRDEQRAASPRWLFAAGALLGVAALFKQQALAWLPVLALAAILGPRPSWRFLPARFAAIASGLAVPLLATYAVFAGLGDASAFLFWTIFYNFGYAQQPMETGEILLRIAKYFLPFIAATLGLWFVAPRSWAMLSRYHRLLIASTLVCCLPIVFIGFRMYPHYFVPLYVPLALAAAPYLSRLFTRPLTRWAKLFGTYAFLSLLSFSVANGVLYLSQHEFHWEEHKKVYAKVARVLHADACYDGASMFTWGGPGALFIHSADLAAASRFVGAYSTICGYVPGNWAIRSGRASGANVIRADHWDQLMGDLERNHATYFLDATGVFANWRAFPLKNFPRMTDFVAAHYDLIGTTDGVRIHRWRGCRQHP